ncbi:MAG TPA: FAD:protein FMN transferase [Gaiellaceae bacterium]|nr:FAD:protein FMN transferase [Gaiellaceae bacterium]
MIAELASTSFPALGTTASVCVSDADALAAAQQALERELAGVDLACSRFRDDSELVRLNAAAGTGPVEVGPLLLEAVEVALAAAASTGGLVDPTVGRTLRLAGYDRRFATITLRDGASFRARYADVPGSGGVHVDRRSRTIRLDPDVELDLGATAKALASDRSAAAARRAAGCGVLVSLGGDVSVAGPAPAGGWPIRVADDHAASPDEPGPAVAIRAGGLATSGTTVRRWQAGAVELHHIVDPRTGRPAETPWRTVTVAGRSCVEANVASTAAIVLGEDAPAWLEARGAAARLVRGSGEVVLTGRWPEDAA